MGEDDWDKLHASLTAFLGEFDTYWEVLAQLNRVGDRRLSAVSSGQ